MGWSWGTTLMATYTTQNPGKVERLVLYAPGWIRNHAVAGAGRAGPLGAYRMVTREQAQARWLTGVPEDKKAALIPAGWFDAWADATFATDPVGAKRTRPCIRAPNGVHAGRRRVLGRRQALLRSREDHRADAAGACRMGPRHAALHGADAVSAARSTRRASATSMLAEGTHTIIMEKNRLMLFEAVQAFLDEGEQVVIVASLREQSECGEVVGGGGPTSTKQGVFVSAERDRSPPALRLRYAVTLCRKGGTASNLHQLVRQLVAVSAPRREVLGQDRAALLDRGDEAVARLAPLHAGDQAAIAWSQTSGVTLAWMPASATISA